MSKYCKEMTEKIAEKLRKGMPRTRTCDGVGINFDTFCEWMKRPEFSEVIKKAESDFIETQVQNIQEHANVKKNFYASAWLLERRCYDEFGNKQKIEHTGENGKEIKITITRAKE